MDCSIQTGTNESWGWEGEDWSGLFVCFCVSKKKKKKDQRRRRKETLKVKGVASVEVVMG